MKFSFTTGLVLVLALTETTGASSWFSKPAYNKWHETELERWLSDHDVPYPSPADRKDLENLVKTNWDSKIQVPVGQTVDQAQGSFHNVRDWIFDSWTDSQLKAFLDKHGIPSPQPRRRDTLLTTVRENYEAVAKKLGESASYPGDWLYQHWTESELKEYLDERGFPVPQPTTRDRLIASVRRNARLASQKEQGIHAEAASSAAAAQSSLTNALFDAWSDSDFKKFFDEHNIKVPQGSKHNELVALARKHSSLLVEPSASATSVWGAATSKAGNEYAKATDDAQLKTEDAFNTAIKSWSDSRLKAFLDARGVPVPQGGKRDELLAKVRLNQHKAANAYSPWTFDTWTTENLKKYLGTQNKKAAEKAGATRDDLLKMAQDSYQSASKTGGSSYASVTSYLSSATDAATGTVFDTWSESELKNYLDSYGLPAYQGSNINELRAAARRHANYFRYGTSSPGSTMYARLQNGAQWLMDQLKLGAASGRVEGEKAAESAKKKGHKISEEL
ncbi:hypothetical protein FQN54_003982 [Arachnomyces sp. PD_36]|nr:hypothetical protein FQN54_003982 [Arachnomyces sp. PD_36]